MHATGLNTGTSMESMEHIFQTRNRALCEAQCTDHMFPRPFQPSADIPLSNASCRAPSAVTPQAQGISTPELLAAALQNIGDADLC